ncbi:hypothetical protein GCM10010954_11490 [Halobacillus andaensis]|uniref:Uncharacterized protein n=1 Tax=Halobacillus andaensis TaxID=1176239 RepID=A0A917B092_HALAA|nr:hypothetical protein [Halobacillus andaensis]MBP2003945.1 hypothetical protein [Halobacillus andaensis]GGF14572.1 hypothetical protein GCM10010954_11490 [Halobacillus andaensis]
MVKNSHLNKKFRVPPEPYVILLLKNGLPFRGVGLDKRKKAFETIIFKFEKHLKERGYITLSPVHPLHPSTIVIPTFVSLTSICGWQWISERQLQSLSTYEKSKDQFKGKSYSLVNNRTDFMHKGPYGLYDGPIIAKLSRKKSDLICRMEGNDPELSTNISKQECLSPISKVDELLTMIPLDAILDVRKVSY